MNREQILHDISIAYLLYRNISADNDPLSFEAFYQEYESIKDSFKRIVDHYNQ